MFNPKYCLQYPFVPVFFFSLNKFEILALFFTQPWQHCSMQFYETQCGDVHNTIFNQGIYPATLMLPKEYTMLWVPIRCCDLAIWCYQKWKTVSEFVSESHRFGLCFNRLTLLSYMIGPNYVDFFSSFSKWSKVSLV